MLTVRPRSIAAVRVRPLPVGNGDEMAVLSVGIAHAMQLRSLPTFRQPDPAHSEKLPPHYLGKLSIGGERAGAL